MCIHTLDTEKWQNTAVDSWSCSLLGHSKWLCANIHFCECVCVYLYIPWLSVATPKRPDWVWFAIILCAGLARVCHRGSWMIYTIQRTQGMCQSVSLSHCLPISQSVSQSTRYNVSIKGALYAEDLRGLVWVGLIDVQTHLFVNELKIRHGRFCCVRCLYLGSNRIHVTGLRNQDTKKM